MRRCDGVTLIEMVVVVLILGLVVAAILPSIALQGRAERCGAAARQLATLFQALRFRAVSDNRVHGLSFRRDATGWFWYVVRDGNANGLRTAEIDAGTDRILSGPHRLRHHDSGVRPGFLPGMRVPRIPPATGSLDGSDDPIRFGVSDLVSFGPLGTASSGTIYLTDGVDTLFGVSLYGPTTRVRVWRFSGRRGVWSL